MMQRRMQETMLQSRMGLQAGQSDPSLGKRHAIDFLVSGAGSGPGAGGSDAGAHAVNAPGKEPADKRPACEQRRGDRGARVRLALCAGRANGSTTAGLAGGARLNAAPVAGCGAVVFRIHANKHLEEASVPGRL